MLTRTKKNKEQAPRLFLFLSYTFCRTVDKIKYYCPLTECFVSWLETHKNPTTGWQILRKEPRCGARKTLLLHNCYATVLRLHPVVSFLAKATAFCAKTRTRGWNFATIWLPCGEGCHTGQICTTFAQKNAADFFRRAQVVEVDHSFM